MARKTKNAFECNADEIKYHILNSLIAGSLVFLGTLSTGKFTFEGLAYGIFTGLIVAVTKFQAYWKTQENEYRRVTDRKPLALSVLTFF